MRKDRDLSDFDEGEIVPSQRSGTSTSKIPRLVSFSQSAVISIMKSGSMTLRPGINTKELDVHASSKEMNVGDCPA